LLLTGTRKATERRGGAEAREGGNTARITANMKISAGRRPDKGARTTSLKKGKKIGTIRLDRTKIGVRKGECAARAEGTGSTHLTSPKKA